MAGGGGSRAGRGGRSGKPARPARPGARGGAARGAGAGRGAGRPAARRAQPASSPAPVEQPPAEPLRLTYVEGATPAKWIRAWRDRMEQRLEHELVVVERQTDALRAGDADAAIVRLPIDEDGLHVMRLYDERAFVVVPSDHVVADVSSVTLADLEGESVIERGTMTFSELVEVVASGAGVAHMPQSLARLHQRRDVASVPVDDLPPTTVALAWRRERDADDVQTLAGIVRGRSARSSR